MVNTFRIPPPKCKRVVVSSWPSCCIYCEEIMSFGAQQVSHMETMFDNGFKLQKTQKKIRHLTSCMLRETWLFQRTKCQIWGNKCLQYTAWGRLGKVLKLYIFKDFAYIQGFEIWRVHACYFKNYKIFDISMNHHWRMKDFVHISMPIYTRNLCIYIKAFPSWPFIFDWNISMYIKAHLLAFPYITIQKTWVLYISRTRQNNIKPAIDRHRRWQASMAMRAACMHDASSDKHRWHKNIRKTKISPNSRWPWHLDPAHGTDNCDEHEGIDKTKKIDHPPMGAEETKKKNN